MSTKVRPLELRIEVGRVPTNPKETSRNPNMHSTNPEVAAEQNGKVHISVCDQVAHNNIMEEIQLKKDAVQNGLAANINHLLRSATRRTWLQRSQTALTIKVAVETKVGNVDLR